MTEKLIIVNESELKDMFWQGFDELKKLIESQKSNSNEWIASTQVASYLGVSNRCWQNYRDQKLIPYSQVGRKIWVKRSDLDAFLESCSIGKHNAMSNPKNRRA